jgi:chemotaxis protein MotA
MDLATLIGLIAALGIVGVVMIMDGGTPAELFSHPSALLLIFGGAFVATMMTVPLEVALKLPKYIGIAFKVKKVNMPEIIEVIARMADKARREGLLALEEESKKIDDAFLRKGIMLVVDGTDPAQVRTILELEIEHMEERHAAGIGFFGSAGGFAPTFGIIGTVMGLISVLKQLDDPSKLAKSIAAAFLATLWGLLSANLLWLPIGGKLQSRSSEEVAFRRMMMEGILSLQAGENPRIIKEKLSTFLPPAERGKEGKKGKQSAAAPAAGEQRQVGGQA